MNVYDFYITPDEYAAAQDNGISPVLLEQRIRLLAWPKSKAIITPPHKKNPIKDWVKIAERNGICYSTLRYRINRLGWDPERAATQPLQDRKKQAKKAHESSRKYPKEITDLLAKHNIPYDTFRHRIKAGWDMYEAATKPKMTRREIGLMTKEQRSKEFKRFFKKKRTNERGCRQ